MAKKYIIKDSFPLRVEEMETVTATELKNSTADVLDRVAETGYLAVTRHDKAKAILLSPDQYNALKGDEPAWLNDIKEECYAMYERMQSPEQKEAAKALFRATPEELGAAAVRAAMKQNLPSA